MRNKKLINRKKTTLHKDGSSALLNIALEKEGEKKKKKKSYYNTGYSYLVTHPSTISVEQDLTLLSRRNMLLSLWHTVNAYFFSSQMRKGIKKRKNI